MDLPVPELRASPEETRVVWISDPRLPERSGAAEPDLEESEGAAIPVPLPVPVPVPENLADESRPAAPDPAPAESRALEPARDEEPVNRELRADDAGTVVPDDAPERGDRLDDDAAPAIDWDAERRRAVAMVLERRERESGYATFSLDDVVEEEPPARFAQGPSIFDSPANRSSRRSLLQPGSGRTAVGRWVSNTCHALTGGIGVFGVASICAAPGPRMTLFPELRPDYMRKLPLCSEVPVPAIDGGEATTTTKCRLVFKEELLDRRREEAD